jgi:uncharacterized protein (TIGR03643 family)
MESLTPQEIDRVIEMAWEDRTPFDAIRKQFSLKEADVIALMRRELLPKSFERWRKRVSGRATKHLKKKNVYFRYIQMRRTTRYYRKPNQ